ncbi:MAG: YdaU family protein, partial [bacterium]
MNYYEHHLGDWAAATGHLTWDEDMAYTRLLRAYYHHEKAIADGQQYRLAKASTPGQRRAVDQVLSEFFELRDGQYHQKRADAEIARYQDKQRKAKASADARWSQSGRNANASPDAMRTHSEGNTLQTPDTRHQKEPPNPRKRGQVSEFPPGFDAFWSAYPRKQAKGAAIKA